MGQRGRRFGARVSNWPGGTNDGQASVLDAAVEFLRDVLGDDVVPSKTVGAEAKEVGIAWVTLRRASGKMGAKKRRWNGGKWYWSRPESDMSKLPRRAKRAFTTYRRASYGCLNGLQGAKADF